ncbi:MAG: nucleotidyltransferase family protein [Desulfobacterales bacterium]|nr:nucleotidyltransferase family protein [Desulfobacterales bacterium]
MLDKLITDNRDAILYAARKHGAENVRVFGSRARGDVRSDSDVDILAEAGKDVSPFFPGGLLMDLQDILGCKVHVTEPDALHHAIRDQILKEAVFL